MKYSRCKIPECAHLRHQRIGPAGIGRCHKARSRLCWMSEGRHSSAGAALFAPGRRRGPAVSVQCREYFTCRSDSGHSLLFLRGVSARMVFVPWCQQRDTKCARTRGNFLAGDRAARFGSGSSDSQCRSSEGRGQLFNCANVNLRVKRQHALVLGFLSSAQKNLTPTLQQLSQQLHKCRTPSGRTDLSRCDQTCRRAPTGCTSCKQMRIASCPAHAEAHRAFGAFSDWFHKRCRNGQLNLWTCSDVHCFCGPVEKHHAGAMRH